MKRFMHALAAVVLLAGVTAKAQYPPRYDQRYQDERDRNRSRYFERIRADLDRADASALPFTGDRARIARARQEVSELQQRMEQGSYDVRSFNEAITAVQNVVDGNRFLSDSSRDSLASDLSWMRDYRERLEDVR